jgi:hypothetical protein
VNRCCCSQRSIRFCARVGGLNRQEIVPTLPGSSSRRFNVSSRVARKGNGKNLATGLRSAFGSPPWFLGSPFANLPPFSFGRQYAMENYKTSLRHRLLEQFYLALFNPQQRATIEVTKMPAQNTVFNRCQGFPFLNPYVLSLRKSRNTKSLTSSANRQSVIIHLTRCGARFECP